MNTGFIETHEIHRNEKCEIGKHHMSDSKTQTCNIDHSCLLKTRSLFDNKKKMIIVELNYHKKFYISLNTDLQKNRKMFIAASFIKTYTHLRRRSKYHFRVVCVRGQKNIKTRHIVI